VQSPAEKYRPSRNSTSSTGRAHRDIPSSHGADAPLRELWTREISGRAKNESRLGSESRPKYRKRLSACPDNGDPRFSHTRPNPDLSRLLHRSDYLHFSSGTASLWEVTGWAPFSVWRSRQLDTRRWASSICTAVIRDRITFNRSLSFPRNPAAILAHVYART
jgi:hypothetical protein